MRLRVAWVKRCRTAEQWHRVVHHALAKERGTEVVLRGGKRRIECGRMVIFDDCGVGLTTCGKRVPEATVPKGGAGLMRNHVTPERLRIMPDANLAPGEGSE